MAVENMRTRGIVQLEEYLDGKLIGQVTADNVVAFEFRKQQAAWMAGKGAFNSSTNPLGFKLPGFMAVGVGTSPAATNQKTVTELVTEVMRNDIATAPAILTNGTRFRTIFGANDIAADIKEIMMFDLDHLTTTVEACDSLGSWTTGTNQTLTINTTARRVGSGSLQSATTAASPSNDTFRNAALGGLDISVSATRLQLWFYVDDASKLSGNLTIELSSSTSDDTDEWQWLVAASGLVNGWNYIDLVFSDATIVGSPVTTNIVRFRLHVAKTHPVTTRIDHIRTFKATGTGLSRVELSPAYTKQIGSVLNITWSILPDFESKTNTFLWTTDDASAIIADITTLLVETGSGTFPTVSSHPWVYTKMWLPAASGYMTGGKLALDSKDGTVALWIRFTGSTTGDPTIWDWRQDSSNLLQIRWETGGSRFRIAHVVGGVGAFVNLGDADATDDYAFVVMSWDSSAKLVRGNLNGGSTKGSTTITADISAITNEMTLGGGSGLPTTDQKIGPVLMFNRVLTDTEISALFVINRLYVYGEQ